MRTVSFICVSGLVLLASVHSAISPVLAAGTADAADCSVVATPNQKKDEETIRRIEQDWLTAEYRGNPRYLECLLDPDYRTSGRDGKVRSRQEVINHVTQTTDMTREVPKLESIVFVHGDTAAAHSILRGTDKAGKPKEVHFVDSYTFHDGHWHAFGGADL